MLGFRVDASSDSLPSDEALRELFWSEAAEAPTLDPALWRVDHLCRLMRYTDYRDEASAFGWRVAFIESDDISERPFQVPELGATNFASKSPSRLLI